MKKCGKIWYSQTGHRCEGNMEHVFCMLDNKGKNADTHSEYVILFAFSWQQQLHECASMLGLYIHYLSSCCLI